VVTTGTFSQGKITHFSTSSFLRPVTTAPEAGVQIGERTRRTQNCCTEIKHIICQPVFLGRAVCYFSLFPRQHRREAILKRVMARSGLKGGASGSSTRFRSRSPSTRTPKRRKKAERIRSPKDLRVDIHTAIYFGYSNFHPY
jgi:hypothetical protein